MAHVTNKLKNSIEGALAGGGDPATSPLYVFGPFLKLIVVAGVAEITFGASVWLVILTIAVVSAVYRLVMQWVTDGSGGSGLSEEEFGGWAVKIDAAITFIEYTLTFLVSMAAMVTFIADRIPLLNEKVLWIQYRTIVAILLSVLIGYVVNRGPKMAVRIFGPATAGVLFLLWTMVFSTVLRHGFKLPNLNLEAFSPQYLNFTIGGFVRILAVMTGIEVFANLVAAYDGSPARRSRTAFNSLLIIMGTTAVTMLIVGPAIFQLSDPRNTHVSVFTQTMDQLLPAPLAWMGTFIGAAVLMSASAAAAQGIQNLGLGLTKRRYIPPVIGRQNPYGVADKPVWIQVGIVAICFLFFGTHEETYLAIYAAGVFILLSLVGWAVTKRLIRQVRKNFSLAKAALIGGTTVAALLTTGSTLIIFEERFLEGAWTYFLLIPMFFIGFTYFRNRLGAPSPIMEYLGRFESAQLAGFGFGQMAVQKVLTNGDAVEEVEISWQPEPIDKSRWREERISIERIAVLLDGSTYAAQAIPYAKAVAQATGAHLTLLSSVKNHTQQLRDEFEATRLLRQTYLDKVAIDLAEENIQAEAQVRPGFLVDSTKALVEEKNIDLVITSTKGKSGNPHWHSGGISSKLMSNITTPVLLVHAFDEADAHEAHLDRILVSLDGSIFSERVLPYARALASAFDSELVLLAVPEVPEVEDYRAPGEAIEAIRTKTVANMDNFLNAVARSLKQDDIHVRAITTGSLPVRTIVSVSDEEDVDMIMLTSRGRGGLDLLFMGSVAERVVAQTTKAVFMMPILDRPEVDTA
jgi:nucleotide-binding universal stress UspA family protein